MFTKSTFTSYETVFILGLRKSSLPSLKKQRSSSAATFAEEGEETERQAKRNRHLHLGREVSERSPTVLAASKSWTYPLVSV